MPWSETEHGAVWIVSGRMGAAGLIPLSVFYLLGVLLFLIRTSRIKEGIDTVLEVTLKEGYRLFDTARAYSNEAEIGKALQKFFKDGIIKRKDIFITSKLWYILADRIFQC